MPAFGGNRGGKRREDGLAPGSAEAIAADRDKEAARKRKERAERARLAQPPPLPAAGESAPGAMAPAMPGQQPVLVAAVPSTFVAWEAEKLKRLTDQVLDTIEDLDVDSFVKVATAGKLPDPVLKKLAKDSRWHPVGKGMLKSSAPRLAAKYLNKTGISAEYQEEMEFSGGAVLILKQRNALMKELREMVAELKAALAKSEEKK